MPRTVARYPPLRPFVTPPHSSAPRARRSADVIITIIIIGPNDEAGNFAPRPTNRTQRGEKGNFVRKSNGIRRLDDSRVRTEKRVLNRYFVDDVRDSVPITRPGRISYKSMYM